mmetsp:Transcript_4042/g.3938  ORF Transcript_4042/g.3938 Transcript_4042/m.3938 type:complete len:106 (+) Transcript_4042:1764-2081(+)
MVGATKVNKFSSHNPNYIQSESNNHKFSQPDELNKHLDSKEEMSSINDIVDRDDTKQSRKGQYLPNIHDSRALQHSMQAEGGSGPKKSTQRSNYGDEEHKLQENL